MKNSIIFKTLVILGSVIIFIFVSAGYLFLQSDKKLIDEIRQYNLNSTLEALDKREEITLTLNKEQIENSIDRISKNTSLFLINYDIDGLKSILNLEFQKDGIKAIKVWDSVIEETFLVLSKEKNTIKQLEKLSKDFDGYTQLKKDISHLQGNIEEKIGEVTFYYDESFIKNKIKKLKDDSIKKIENFNQNIDKKQLESNFIKLYLALGTLVTILFVISILLIKFVNNPLKKLQNGLNEFFDFLQNKTDSVRKIDICTKDEFGDMANSLNENISVSAKLHEEIYELNTNLEQKIQEKTTKVTTLLDNADQGFLSFGEDMLIDDEYSKECINIFKCDISHKDIAELLYKDGGKKEFFVDTLKILLNESNEHKIKTIISLLQSEFIINKKAINIKYKVLEDKRFMLILTDITKQKILQKKINKEKNILKMIVSVVSDTDEFFELIDDFKEFINSKNTLVDFNKTPLHNVTELYRTIHTFKGLFAQKEMFSLVSKLHNLESELSEMLSDMKTTNKALFALLEDSEFEKWLDNDVEIIKEILGDELFEIKGKISVKEETLSKIEQNIIALAKKHDELDAYEPVVNDIKKLKYKTVSSLFSGYPKLLDQLSQSLEKSIYPLNVIVQNDLKIEDKFKPFIKSLVHVFRNAIDHGIETMDERAEIGKDEFGTISCSVKQVENNLCITIADDGRGLDKQKILQKAKDLSIDTLNLSENQIFELIFNDRFSTKEEVSELSGRGVGMAAVKIECDKLNGYIKIKSKKDIGTTIEFIIPL